MASEKRTFTLPLIKELGDSCLSHTLLCAQRTLEAKYTRYMVPVPGSFKSKQELRGTSVLKERTGV